MVNEVIPPLSGADPFSRSSKLRRSDAPRTPLYTAAEYEELEDVGEEEELEELGERKPSMSKRAAGKQPDLGQLNEEELQAVHEYLQKRRTGPAPAPKRAYNPPSAFFPVEQRDHRSAKITDAPMLSDGESPTFRNWRKALEDKFSVNGDHFHNEEAKMAYLFGRTEGDANQHLDAVYRTNTSADLESAAELVQYLQDIYENPNERADARHLFQLLHMAKDQTFTSFRTRFVHLANAGGFPHSEWKEEMYLKLNEGLGDRIMAVRHTYPTFTSFCQALIRLDNDHHNLRQAAASRPAAVAARVAARSSRMLYPALTAPARASTSSNNLPKKPTLLLEAPKGDKSHLTCYNCNKKGHIRPDCKERPGQNVSIRALQEQSGLSVAELYAITQEQRAIQEEEEMQEDETDQGKALA